VLTSAFAAQRRGLSPHSAFFLAATCAAYHQRVSVDSPDDLYGLALDRFVPARAALVKQLRGEKQRERANEVAALRKPSVAAWAVNQVVRTQPKALQALFAAGNDLARAQERAAAGRGGGDAVRDATHRQREVLRELLEAAQGLLGSEGQGVSQATIERVGETLRAAANDEDARRQVAGGCLTRELRFVGLGIDGSTPPLGGQGDTRTLPGQETSQSDEPDQGRGRRRERREADTGSAAATREAEIAREAEAEAERAAARERTAALKAAHRNEAHARRAAARAQKELASAQVRREQVVAALEEAETLVSVAAQRAENAKTELTIAEQALRELGQ
jgi:hypothetical protein